jgi:hypothetical protein
MTTEVVEPMSALASAAPTDIIAMTKGSVTIHPFRNPYLTYYHRQSIIASEIPDMSVSGSSYRAPEVTYEASALTAPERVSIATPKVEHVRCPRLTLLDDLLTPRADNASLRLPKIRLTEITRFRNNV